MWITVKTMETEVQLLELLITAESKTKAAFAKKIGMSRQNINYHIREAEKNNGKLSSEFRHVLEDHGLDLYRFQTKPTNQSYQNTLPPSIVAENEKPLMKNNHKEIERLERELELMNKLRQAEKELNEARAEIRLRQVEKERDEARAQIRLKELEKERDEARAQVPAKKDGRRHSA